MNKIFLARCKVKCTPYMGKTRCIDDIRLVEAETIDDAREKYERWWSDRSEEYSVHYAAYGSDITEMIK